MICFGEPVIMYSVMKFSTLTLAATQVYVKAKECSEQVSVEEFAIGLAKHFVSFYQQVSVVSN